jgi:hypothetical protein
MIGRLYGLRHRDSDPERQIDRSFPVSEFDRTTRLSQPAPATGADSIGIGVRAIGKGSPDDRTGLRFDPLHQKLTAITQLSDGPLIDTCSSSGQIKSAYRWPETRRNAPVRPRRD